ncbi:MAG: DUF4838 domain-containing protein [Elusimicrobiota bacterium]|nr:DUF4838 domain-containing protein [Elusimicrobiota bacterium]
MSVLLLAALAAHAGPVPAALCRGGRPAMPVVVAASASGRTRRAAADLAASLGRVCGAAFKVREGDGATGLALGTAADFPALVPAGGFDAPEPMRREQFLLRSGPEGLRAVGATEAGVEAASAEILRRAGWRRYFPGPAWEVVPSRPDLALAADETSAPAFAARRIWYDFGYLDSSRSAYDEWARRNRVPGGFELRTGHSFDAVRARHEAEFAAHPEYLALVGGRRVSDKFCLSNPALRRLVVEDALGRLQRGRADSVSLEPSDGDGWCECSACRALGGPSDRLALLATEAAAALAERFPGRVAGFYAYHRHSPPPKARLPAGIVVSVAAAYQASGWTTESLLEAWREKTTSPLGVREYYGVFKWHQGLPGRMRGADLSYLARSIPRYHALGARFMSAESGEDWGAHGLGHYAATRILWDLSEAGRVDAIKEEFLEDCFGPAKAPMRRWYAAVDGSRGLAEREVPPALVAELYGRLAEAWPLAADAAARRRLADLALYARFVELHAAYSAAGAGRGEAFAALVRHARRMRGRMLVHLKGLEEWLPARDPAAKLPPDDGAPEYTQAEAEAVLTAGAAR